MIADVNVLEPANVCELVETKPVDPLPAIGILNVCDEPTEDILKKSPEVPVSNNCVTAVMPLIEEIPPESMAQVNPDPEEESAFKI